MTKGGKMQITNIHEAKATLSELIRKAIAGEEVIIARANEPLVRLEPVIRDTRPRAGGQWAGQIRYSDDFEAADPEFEREFYDGPVLPSGSV
jgi:prevent-host-death family protein